MCIYSFHFLNKKKKKNFSFTFAVLSVNFEFQQLWLLVWHLLDFIHLTLNSCKISSASLSWTGYIFMAWIFRLGFLLSQWILRVSSFECLFCFSLCSTIWPFNSCFVCWSLAWLCFLFFFFWQWRAILGSCSYFSHVLYLFNFQVLYLLPPVSLLTCRSHQMHWLVDQGMIPGPKFHFHKHPADDEKTHSSWIHQSLYTACLSESPPNTQLSQQGNNITLLKRPSLAVFTVFVHVFSIKEYYFFFGCRHECRPSFLILVC